MNTHIVLGSGTYSHVIKPAILCECFKDKLNPKKKYVSKIMNTDTFFDFMHNEALIKNIGNKKYFIFSEHFCKIRDLDKMVDKKLADEIKDAHDSTYEHVNIVMINGGICLSDFIKKHTNYSKHNEMLKNNINLLIVRFMKILKMLNKYKLVHGDIKLENFMFDVDKNITKTERETPKKYLNRIKLIDFDLTHKFGHFEILRSYYAYPIEYNVYINKNLSLTKIMEDLKINCEVNVTSQCELLVKKLLSKFKDPTYTQKKFTDEYDSTFDTYSVGYMLSRLIKLFPEKNVGIVKNTIDILIEMDPGKRLRPEDFDKYINALKNNVDVSN